MTDESSPQPSPFLADSENPYSAAPIEDSTFAANVDGDLEAIRKHHLSHEASVKSIGTLYILGAIFLVLIGVGILFQGLTGRNPGASWFSFMLGLGYLALGLVQGLTAIGLSRLRPGARIPAIVLSIIGLLAFPVGTLISAYFLYLLICAKGRMVLSEQYQSVVTQTPHIKYKTSIFVWILLGLLMLVLAIAITATLFAA